VETKLGLTALFDEELKQAADDDVERPELDEEFTSRETKKTGVVVHHWVWMHEQVANESRVVGMSGL
jgi:hypothetical protein